MRKPHNELLVLVILTCVSAAAGADTVWDNGYVWEYYDFYEAPSEQVLPRIQLQTYTLDNQENEEDRFLWKLDSAVEWHIEPWVGWVYAGETEVEKADAEVRMEDDRVVLVLTPEYVEKNGLYEYRPEQGGFCPVGLEEEMAVTLYDFNVKPGDRYPTIIFGNLLTVANVVETSFREDILDGVRQVKILTDFNIQYSSLDYEPGMKLDDFAESRTLSYIEKIGNISYGTFTELNPLWYDASDGKHFETRINNVFDASGNVVYKGLNFEGMEGGIDGIELDSVSLDAIYDLHGRPVATPVPGSVYTRNGKKFVAR